MDIKKQLADLSSAFETRINKGETYWCLKDSERETYQDLVRDIHSTDILPDNYRYSIISKISDELVHNLPWQDIATVEEFEEKAEELRHECVDGLVSIYNSELLEWVASHGHRPSYVDEAVREYGAPDSLLKQLQLGQYYEIDAIYSRFIKYFAEFCEE